MNTDAAISSAMIERLLAETERVLAEGRVIVREIEEAKEKLDTVEVLAKTTHRTLEADSSDEKGRVGPEPILETDAAKSAPTPRSIRLAANHVAARH